MAAISAIHGERGRRTVLALGTPTLLQGRYSLVSVRSFYAVNLIIDPSIEYKLRHNHNLTGDQVREVVLFGGHTEARWNENSVHGGRWVVRGMTYEGIEIIAYVLPTTAGDGVHVLKTAIRCGDVP